MDKKELAELLTRRRLLHDLDKEELLQFIKYCKNITVSNALLLRKHESEEALLAIVKDHQNMALSQLEEAMALLETKGETP